MALDVLCPACTAGGRVVDLFRVDIIADAMDHADPILQLRMIVNAIATSSQLKLG